MLLCSGVYQSAFSTNLRFLSFAVLCTDSTGSAASGSVKLKNISKSTIERCINHLRKNCESMSLQCRSKSRQAEQYFDNTLKFTMMPEYVVPYAIYLLSICKDTPSAGGSGLQDSNHGEKSIHADDSYEDLVDDGNNQRLLRKRLKCLLEPLVQTLGDSADNITFLLRMAEILGHKYCPIIYHGSIDLNEASTEVLQSPISFDDDAISFARMKVVCSATREILMNFVKKDVHLTPYPGTVNIPSALYARVNRHSINEHGNVTIEDSSKSKSSNRVHFSPDVNDLSKNRAPRRDLFSQTDHTDRRISGSKRRIQSSLESSISPIPPVADASYSLSPSDFNAQGIEEGSCNHEPSRPQTTLQQSSSSSSSSASKFLNRQPLTDANARDLKRRKKISPVSVSIDSINSHESERISHEDDVKVASSTQKIKSLAELDFNDDGHNYQSRTNRRSLSNTSQSRIKR